MALVALQGIVRSGLVASYATPGTANTFPNDGKVIVHLKNTNGATRTATVVSQATPDVGETTADDVVTVAATTGDVFMGPFPPHAFNDPDTGLATLNLSATAGVTLAILHLP